VVSGRDLTHVRDGENRILFGREHYGAVGLDPGTSFNDIYCDERGRVLAGAVWGGAFDENAKGALVLVTEPGQAEVIYDGVVGSNGIAIDHLRQRVYQCSSYNRRIIVSQPHGDSFRKVGEISTEAMPGFPDGLKLDDEGNLWVACHTSNAVARLDPEGRLEERIEVPSNDVTSLCFTGATERSLIVVTADNAENPELRGCIFSTPTTVRGVPPGVAAI
jgi:sugar lactone lactonase YvrE